MGTLHQTKSVCIDDLANERLEERGIKAIAKIELVITEDHYIELKARLQTKKLRKAFGCLALLGGGLTWVMKGIM